jgi:hypothetical protein
MGTIPSDVQRFVPEPGPLQLEESLVSNRETMVVAAESGSQKPLSRTLNVAY